MSAELVKYHHEVCVGMGIVLRTGTTEAVSRILVAPGIASHLEMAARSMGGYSASGIGHV